MTELAKKEVKAPEDEKAVGSYTGGDVRMGKVGESTSVSQTYVGVGPLLIPCTRGEQKALSGDVMVSVFVDHPTDPELDYEYIFLLPREVADKILELIGTTDPPVTQAAYQKFLDDRANRVAKMAVLSAQQSKSGSSEVLSSRTTGQAPTRTPNRS
jgi:hypothetical protein